LENDIILYATSYVALRATVIAGFAYVFYRILRRNSLPLAMIENNLPDATDSGRTRTGLNPVASSLRS